MSDTAAKERARGELERLGLTASDESLEEIVRQLEVLTAHAKTFLDETLDSECEPLPEYRP